MMKLQAKGFNVFELKCIRRKIVKNIKKVVR